MTATLDVFQLQQKSYREVSNWEELGSEMNSANIEVAKQIFTLAKSWMLLHHISYLALHQNTFTKKFDEHSYDQ